MAAVNKLPQTLQLKTIETYYLTVMYLRSPDRLGCFLCSESHKAEIKMSVGWDFISDSGKNLLLDSFRLLAICFLWLEN